MKTVTLSAKKLPSDLQAEFGEITPAFLPIKNNIVLEWHSKLSDQQHYVTLDQDYQISNFERSKIAFLGIKILNISGLSSLKDVLNDVFKKLISSHGLKDEEMIRILYGDSICERLPNTFLKKSDAGLIGQTQIPNDGDWYRINESDITFSGVFQFSYQMIRKIIASSNDDKDFFDRIISSDSFELVKTDNMYDLGRSHTYHKNKLIFSPVRHFNKISLDNYVFTKTGPIEKINAEFEWFKKLPVGLQPFTPKIFKKGCSKDQAYYQLETIYESNISDTIIHGKLSASSVDKIYSEIENFLQKSKTYQNGLTIDLKSEFNSKLEARAISEKMCEFVERNRLEPVFQSIYDAYKKANEKILPDSDPAQIVHGDLCYSNILYNFKKNTIKLIDPRGLTLNGKEQSIYGSQFYDIIKLGHSAAFGYDLILRGIRANEIIKNENINCAAEHYWNLRHITENKYSKRQIILGIGNLFITMIPLHSDNNRRQLEFFKLAQHIIGTV